MDIERARDAQALASLVAEFAKGAQNVAAEAEAAPARVRLLSSLLEQVQKRLTTLGAADPVAKKEAAALADSLESVAEAIYTRAIEVTGANDLRPHLAYAEHLVFRDGPKKALEVASTALKLKIAALPAWDNVATGLRDVAIRAALAQTDDPARFDRAVPFVKELIASANPRASGIGHLYKGLIALERSGMLSAAAGADGPGTASSVDSKAGEEAAAELKLAAAALPDAATAQALYGVSLILTGEANLGRQYLQAAQKLGGEGLEPRYQVFAAWSILQAGYPEDAAPIVARMIASAESGGLPRDFAPTLHLLMGEILQARRQLRPARAEFEKALASGQAMTPALQVRLAQIDFQLGENDKGMARIEGLKNDPKAGPTAERIAVQALNERNKLAEARARIDQARARFPDSDELAELDAAMHLASGKPEAADALLRDYLAKHPKSEEIALVRARVLSGPLKKPDEARKILADLAETAKTSAPLVQLALLDMNRRDLEGASKTIARIRARWKEAASADLLDAQLALASENPQGAATALDAALKKDPNNKVALFWKAMIDERSGASAKAAQVYESILKDQPVKEIDNGLSLTTAARLALADMALQNQDVDGAISRFQGILKGGAGEMDRAVRWKLIAAMAAKGQDAQARAEVARLVASPATSAEDRVQAAEFFRRQGDDASGLAQLDLALKKDPANTGAVAYKAMMLASKDKAADASALIRKAMAASAQPANMDLMLAALENLAPGPDNLDRALGALSDGLKKHPESVELVQAKYQVLKLKGDKGAVAFVQETARGDARPAMKRLLAEVYRSERRLEEAETVVRDLLKESPKDNKMAAVLVGLVAARAQEAADSGDRPAEKTLNARTAELIRGFREQFPNDPSFPQADCELAARSGDLARAKRIAAEVSEMDPTSPIGPLLRARLFAAEGRTEEVARSYDEALARSPRRTDIRLALAQADLALGKSDEALKQTKYVLDADRDQPTALLLKAQALASREGTPADVAKRRAEAEKTLRDAIAAQPKFVEAYHLLAELRMGDRDRKGAVDLLMQALKIIPNDDTGLAQVIQYLCSASAPGQPAPRADVQKAMDLAEQFGAKDERGVFALALAVGFSRSGQVDLALPWAEKAAQKIDRPIVHMTCGDILLAKAEATTVEADAKEVFKKAVEQYDAVLKQQANAVEAINNKAWILHRYLGRHADALLVAEDLVKRSDPSTLPAEFYDTLGSIQEAVGKPKLAEDSYTQGLRKAPNGPMLNFHLGRLLAADPSRGGAAARHLEAARSSGRLSKADAASVETLLKEIRR